MTRLLPILLGLALLLGAGLAHGLWTGRWQSSQALADAGARLAEIPESAGQWHSEEQKQDADELKLAGAVAHWSRMFTDPDSGEKVLVILLCGKPRQMSVHRPEHCYRSAGYTMSSPASKIQLNLTDQRSAEFWTGNFSRDEAEGPSQMRIFWSWYAPDAAESRWQAPDSPRFAFTGQRALYKIYVIRSMTISTPLTDDPCVKLLSQLLPGLDAALSPASRN